jgi:hypothetical protein
MSVNEMQGPDPVRSADSWVTVGEIARSLHCSNPSTVTNWRKRHEDFPEPVVGGSRPRFRWGSVLEWVLIHRHDWLVEHAPHLIGFQHARLVTAISVALSTVEDLPESSSGGPGVRFAVAAAATLLAVDPGAGDPADPYLALAGDLPDDIRRIVEGAVAEHGVAGVCDQIRDAFESSSRSGFHDPPVVLDLFDSAALVDAPECDVVSLGCGTGRTLARVARQGRDEGRRVRPWGYEIDPALASGAASLLRAEGFDPVVEQRDVLTDPPGHDGASPCAVVLASPSLHRLDPNDRTDESADDARPDDPRWVVASTGERSLVNTWVQVALSLARSMTARSGGASSAAVLVPTAWLGGGGRESRAVRALREWLAVERLLRAVAVAPVARTRVGYDTAALLVVSGRAEVDPVTVLDASSAPVRPTPMGPEFIGGAPGVFGVGVTVGDVSRFVVDPADLASAAADGRADLRPEHLRDLVDAADEPLPADGGLPEVGPLYSMGWVREGSERADPASSSADLDRAVESVGGAIDELAESLDAAGREHLRRLRRRFEELEAIVRAQSAPESPDQESSEPV